MQVYYYLMLYRLPTEDDFTQNDLPELQLFMLYEVLRIANLLTTDAKEDAYKTESNKRQTNLEAVKVITIE